MLLKYLSQDKALRQSWKLYQIGLEEGVILLTGSVGKPEGLKNGNFVKATIFTNVNNKMRIA